MGETMSAADVGAVVNGRGGGWGDNGMYGIIGLLAILGIIGGGFGFGNRNGNQLTEADLCTANSFNELKSQVGRMNDMMFTNARQSDNAICNLGYTQLQQTNDTQRQISSCCCDLKELIREEGNATRAMIQQDKIEALQAEVAELKADRRFCGIPRVPTTWTYSVDPGSLFGGNGTCNSALF